jgi:hypothetical protein
MALRNVVSGNNDHDLWRRWIGMRRDGGRGGATIASNPQNTNHLKLRFRAVLTKDASELELKLV